MVERVDGESIVIGMSKKLLLFGYLKVLLLLPLLQLVCQICCNSIASLCQRM